MWSSQSCTEHTVKTAPSKVSSNWPGCPTSARACWCRPWAWTRTCRSGCSAQPGLPTGGFTADASRSGKTIARKYCTAIKKKFRFPVIRQARDARFVSRNDARDGRHELPTAMDLAAEFAQKIIVERGVTGAKSKSPCSAITSPTPPSPAKSCRTANFSLSRKIPGRRNPPGDSREAHQHAGPQLSKIMRCGRSARLTATAWRAAISFWNAAAARFFSMN